MIVKPITSRRSIEHWCKYRHYAGLVPGNYSYCFGLFNKDQGCLGICLFGSGANYSMNTIFHPYSCFELQRLSFGESAPRNYASFLIAESLKQLSRPMFVVSYADTNYGHIGYVYQATNWIYTGVSDSDILLWYKGHWCHRKTVFSDLGPGFVSKLLKKEQLGKHRYFYLVGSKKQRKKMRRMLEEKFQILPYPKGETARTEIKDKNKLGLRSFFNIK